MADSYDIEGSIVGVENLDSSSVGLVENMGQRVFSERMTSHLLRISSGSLAQNAAWDIVASPFPDGPCRITNIVFIALTASRVSMADLMIADPNSNVEMPIATWASGAVTIGGVADNERPIRFDDDSAGAGTVSYLGQTLATSPQLVVQMGQAPGMPVLKFRGLTSGFGGGTVEVLCYVSHCRPNVLSPAPGHPSSVGLAIPSW
jgi:hypothetical protein